jgi:DNA-binding MarR family transcriptional regulator/N-acetylglutamate synthase-like GNAT family acetyltransferase
MDRVPSSRVAAVRRFNRFYTQRIGMLRQGLYDSPWSLAQVRVLYELAHTDGAVAATDLARGLGLDAGYLSRILHGFVAKGFLRRSPSSNDARRLKLTLTAAGRKAFAPVDRASRDEVAALLAPIADDAQARLVDAMRTVETLLGDGLRPDAALVLRPHRPGDIGWVVSAHGRLYAREYGWDETFEALVAEIAARFVRRYDPRRERCWIAERDGRIVGSVFVVAKSLDVAQLRLLIVEPSARGAGIGRRLVAECIEFARRTGYRRIMLWTNGGLDAARHLYEDAGFRLAREGSHHSFGKDLVGQTFVLDLAKAPRRPATTRP